MRVKPFLFAFLASVLISSCEDEVVFDSTGARYLPMQVGNYWKLVPENPLGGTLEFTVIDEVSFEGKNYFKVHQRMTDPVEPILERDVYYRIDENNYVFFRGDLSASDETNILRLGAPDKYQWKMEGTNTNVYVRKQQEVINGVTLDDCKLFSYNDPSVVDEEHGSIYASGIGFCKIDGGWGRVSRLSEAWVNGVKYNFDH